MNPHKSYRATPIEMVVSLWTHRELLGKLVRHEVTGRYRGSILGLGWSLATPILMLSVYTFVFSFVFKARWGDAVNSSRTEFAVILFVGLIVYGLFAEVLNRSPGLIIANVNYVKKVVFPLEVIPASALGAAIFHSAVSLCVLVVAFLFLNGFLHWTAIFAPIVIAPFAILTLGFAWMLASLGVFVRDIGQAINLATTVMMFLSPVFYPMSALPQKVQILLLLNPLTFIIEQCRAVLVFGQMPNWSGLGLYAIVSVLVAWIGFWWFQNTRKGFADVL